MVEGLQDKRTPNGVCFGCGPKKGQGLTLRNIPLGGAVIADWNQKSHHVMFGKFGGIWFLHASSVDKKWQHSARATKADGNRVNVPGGLNVQGESLR